MKLAGGYLGLLAAALIDARLRVIPNAIPVALVALRLACLVYELFFTTEAVGYLVSSLLGGFVCFVALGIANRASHGGVGMGDVKIVSALGLLCGLYFVLYVLVFSLVICVVAALVLMASRRRSKEDSLPFAPFLFLGYIAAVFVSLA